MSSMIHHHDHITAGRQPLQELTQFVVKQVMILGTTIANPNTYKFALLLGGLIAFQMVVYYVLLRFGGVMP